MTVLVEAADARVRERASSSRATEETRIGSPFAIRAAAPLAPTSASPSAGADATRHGRAPRRARARSASPRAGSRARSASSRRSGRGSSAPTRRRRPRRTPRPRPPRPAARARSPRAAPPRRRGRPPTPASGRPSSRPPSDGERKCRIVISSARSASDSAKARSESTPRSYERFRPCVTALAWS